MILTLDSLLTPYTSEVFLNELLGKAALYVPGAPGKLSPVATWRTLNRLLNFGGLSYPRLRLFKGGQELPESSYAGDAIGNFPGLRVRELTCALREGAALAIESVDELDEPIAVLCQALEASLRVPVQADLFAGWAEPILPSLRCNDHEIVICQLEGRREWQLHCPTIDSPGAPLAPDDLERGPTWSGVLSSDDALYIPSGWHHRDEPADGASLCVIAKFRQPTGLDLLDWMARQLRSSKLRIEVPRFGNARRRSEYLLFFRREIAEAAGRAGAMAGALAGALALAEPRARFSLPWSASPAPLPPSDDWLLVPLVRFPDTCIARCEPAAEFEVSVGSSVNRFDGSLAPIAERVLEMPGIELRELLDGFAEGAPRERVLECVAQLVACGAVWLKEPSPGKWPPPGSSGDDKSHS